MLKRICCKERWARKSMTRKDSKNVSRKRNYCVYLRVLLNNVTFSAYLLSNLLRKWNQAEVCSYVNAETGIEAKGEKKKSSRREASEEIDVSSKRENVYKSQHSSGGQKEDERNLSLVRVVILLLSSSSLPLTSLPFYFRLSSSGMQSYDDEQSHCRRWLNCVHDDSLSCHGISESLEVCLLYSEKSQVPKWVVLSVVLPFQLD